MLSSWIILAALAGIGSNALAFLLRYFLKDKDNSLVWTWFFETTRMISFLAIAFFDFNMQLGFLPIIILFFVGITELFGSYLSMKMHAYNHLSISTILSRTRMIWVPVIALIFLNERLGFSDYLGILVLFAGVSITVSPGKFFIDKGALYANSSALAIAIHTIFLKAALPFASYSVILAASALPSVVILPFFIKNMRKELLIFLREKLWLKTLAVLFHVVSIYLLMRALEIGEVSKVNAIYQGMLITSVLAGIIFFKEREDIFKKCIGTVVTVVGIILLT